MLIAEAGRLERPAKIAVEPGNRREVVDAGDTDPRELLREIAACRAVDRRR